jgi:aldehyde:ferredoxin oxidoreductase
MRGLAELHLLILDTEARRHQLRLLNPVSLDQDPRADYRLLGGEALCQYLLRGDQDAMVIARGPMPFLSGNKTTVGYLSPLTGLPHYSFVGGRGSAELLNLGLDAIVLSGGRPKRETRRTKGQPEVYAVISGRAPQLRVEFKSAAELPTGQRGAFYWLLKHELNGTTDVGSIFTVGEGARGRNPGGERRAYQTANLGVDGLYHAGRGGAGGVFARYLAALVLRGEPMSLQSWLGPRAERFWALRESEIRRRLDAYTERLSRRDGGTVAKLYATGHGAQATLPARNARRLGYSLADLGAGRTLKESRAGQTGCHWCQVNCRHWHWVEVDYAPGGRDRFLDDFEPTYALFAMLDLQPDDDSTQGRLRLLKEVDRSVVLPIEQMGCDVIDIGVALAALFEGVEQGLIPAVDLPPFLRGDVHLGRLDLAVKAVEALRSGHPAPALRAVGDGPQALAVHYPALQKLLFTSGPGTLGNAGHANQLWTFLMPFSRYFGHYVGQLYKIEGELPSGTNPREARPVFEKVIRQALLREFFGCLGNALSTCAFTFVIFSQDGKGVNLDDSDLLVRTLACYGIETRREELAWFAEAFWSQSMAFKLECGWRPPTASNYPDRVYEALVQALHRPADELRVLMELLIAEWKRQATEVMHKYGYEVPPSW